MLSFVDRQPLQECSELRYCRVQAFRAPRHGFPVEGKWLKARRALHMRLMRSKVQLKKGDEQQMEEAKGVVAMPGMTVGQAKPS